MSSNDSCKILLNEVYDKDTIEYKESVYVMLLNRRGRLLGVTKVCEGGMESSICDLKCIFQAALLGKASAIILSHNHPSGDVKPSREDDAITKAIQDAGKILNVNVLDHIIVATDKYFSYADEGRL